MGARNNGVYYDSLTPAQKVWVTRRAKLAAQQGG
jgi:hypothetical protein